MRPQLIKYYNRKGILKLTLNTFPYYADTQDLKNWTWKYDENYGRIENFQRSKRDYTLGIGVAGNSLRLRDALCDIFTEDIIAGEPGTLVVRDWELSCWLVEAEYDYKLQLDRKAKFKVIAATKGWTRRTQTSYNGIAGDGSGADTDLGRDYSYAEGILGRGYDYGYSVTENHYAVIELGGVDNGFECLIYGPQVDPVIYLNGYPVKVNMAVAAGQTLKITSNGSEKTIKLYSSSGIEEDAFVYRDKENTPFIGLGQRTELTFGQIKFDFTTIERRSEPSWT